MANNKPQAAPAKPGFVLGFKDFVAQNPSLGLTARFGESRIAPDTVVQPVLDGSGEPCLLVNFDGSPLGTQLVCKSAALDVPKAPTPTAGVVGDKSFVVDISNYTGYLTPERVDALFAAGVKMVIVRASLETRRDQQAIAQQQLGMLMAKGMPYQAYAWCYWDWDPRWTVDATVEMLEPYRAGYASLPDVGKVLWLDVEEAPSPSVDEEQWLRLAVDRVDASGWLNPGIYTAAWWWVPNLGDSGEFADLPLWVAAYDGDPSPETFRAFGGWTRAIVDQYNGTSTVGGVGNVDVNQINVGGLA